MASPIPRRRVVDPGPRHVIAEYRHRDRLVDVRMRMAGERGVAGRTALRLDLSRGRPPHGLPLTAP